MKGKIIACILIVVAFIVGFFIGDSSAISRVNKQIDSAVSLQKTSKDSASTTSVSKDENTKKDETKKEEPNPAEKTYGIGDTIKISDKYELTLNKVTLTNERNQFSDKKFEKVAVIEYTYKDLNNPEDLFISEINFKAYDEEGNALETYPAGVKKNAQTIAKGKQCTAEMSYGFNKGTKLELNFYDNMFSGKADAKFLVDAK